MNNLKDFKFIRQHIIITDIRLDSEICDNCKHQVKK
jgi:hypothetical protein